MKKVKAISPARDTSTNPPLHPYQILSNYLKQCRFWPAQDFSFRGGNYIKTVRVVSLAGYMPTGPPLHSYQILSNYIYGYQSYGVHKNASMD